jgi:hypothetical protein
LKVAHDLKSDCIYDCCKNEPNYRESQCSANQYCSNRVCNQKQICAYDCCVNEEQYLDKACQTGYTCSGHACTSFETKSFGYTGATSSGNFIANVIAGGLFRIPENGIPRSITAGVYAYGSGFHSKGAIYSQNGNLITYTEEKTIPYPTQGRVTFNITGATPQLNANTDYYLVVWGQGSSSAALASQWTGGNNVIGVTSSYGSFPSTVAFSTVQSGHIASISCNYTAV